MPETYEAVVAGHLCLDVIPDISATTPELFQKTFTPGHAIQVGAAALCTGGPVSNVGLALHKLGIDVQLMGKVGDDVFGQAIRQIIEAHDPHLAEGMIVDPAVSSSYTIVINPPGIDRYFLHAPGANDSFGADDVRYELLERARLFHFGYPPYMRMMVEDDGAQLVDLYRRARATGVTTCLDTAVPDPATPAGKADWVSILRATLPNVDIFLPSIEEIIFMVRRATYDQLDQAAEGHDILPLITPELLSDLSQELLNMGTKVVGFKLGYRGLYLRTAGQEAMAALGRGRPSDLAAWAGKELWAPCFQVDVVGTAGSGDATIAGFLAALLRDMSAEEAVTAAVAVGACNVEAADTLSGIRPWEETMQRIAAGWPRHPMTLDSPGWHFDQTHGLWVGPGYVTPFPRLAASCNGL